MPLKDYIIGLEMINISTTHNSKFISLSLNEYVKEWQIDSNHAKTRNRYMHVQPIDVFPENRFEITGIPTYYERGRIPSYLGLDLTASYIAAIKSQLKTKLQNSESNIDKYVKQLHREINFLNTFWWDNTKNVYKSIIYQDKTYDFYSIGECGISSFPYLFRCLG